jgi:glycine cleavage system H protein
MSTFPNDLRYTDDHEWLRAQGASWRVGITQFAVDQLGDITLVDLPKQGDAVKKGDRFGTVESVKSVSDLYAPVTGKVIAVNAKLKDAPEEVNADPYGKGWMIEIAAADKAEVEALMDADAYTKHVAAQ